MRCGGLFAGIGGMELGLERAGMETAWFVDKEPWCRHILQKHWPDKPVYSDIRDVRGADVGPVEVLGGGFPCQDISNAGKQAGIKGARSSLWKEYARLVDELRPRYVIVENVAVLRRRGLDVVLGDLSALGYDAEWDCIRASDIGAPHRRDRLWLVAYPNGAGLEGHGRSVEGAGEVAASAGCAASGARDVADSDSVGWERRPRVFGPAGWAESADYRARLAVPWTVEPDVGRVAYGVPARVDRLRGLGNALVPQIAEWIGRRIIEWEGMNV